MGPLENSWLADLFAREHRVELGAIEQSGLKPLADNIKSNLDKVGLHTQPQQHQPMQPAGPGAGAGQIRASRHDFENASQRRDTEDRAASVRQ